MKMRVFFALNSNLPPSNFGVTPTYGQVLPGKLFEVLMSLAGSRTATRGEFQTIGPAIENHGQPRVLRWGGGTFPSRFTCCPPQIQKLADRSDVISEVPKCSKIQILPDTVGGAYNAPLDPLTDGEGGSCPCQ